MPYCFSIGSVAARLRTPETRSFRCITICRRQSRLPFDLQIMKCLSSSPRLNSVRWATRRTSPPPAYTGVTFLCQAGFQITRIPKRITLLLCLMKTASIEQGRTCSGRQMSRKLLHECLTMVTRSSSQAGFISSFGDRDPVTKLNLQMNEIRQQLQECKSMVESYNFERPGLSPLTVLRLNLTCGMDVQNSGPSFGGVFVQASKENVDQRFKAFETLTNAAEKMTAGPIVQSRLLPDRDQVMEGRKRADCNSWCTTIRQLLLSTI